MADFPPFYSILNFTEIRVAKMREIWDLLILSRTHHFRPNQDILENIFWHQNDKKNYHSRSDMDKLLCFILIQDISAFNDISQVKEGSPANLFNVTVKQHTSSSKITNNVCKDLAAPFESHMPPMGSWFFIGKNITYISYIFYLRRMWDSSEIHRGSIRLPLNK